MLKGFKLLGLALLASLVLVQTGLAKDWPARPLKLTIAYSAGGTTDMSARLLASLLEKELGQPVVCQNKPGGGGTVAASIAATQKPDGYNIFTLVTAPAAITPHMQDLPFDPLTDFTPIARYGLWHYALVVKAGSPFHSLKDLIAFAKENPGKVSYGLSGAGNPQHLVMERLKKASGADWDAVPFKNGAEAVTACMGGHVTAMAGVTEWAPQVKAGEMRLLAVFDDERMKEFPEVPTLKELGYDIVAPSCLGIAGPKNMPEPIVAKLESAIKKALADPMFVDLMDKVMIKIAYLGSQEFGAYIHKIYEEQGKVINEAGLNAK
ncbi:tripartite tricarboxylate transporter substrate binding protein [Desulfotignum balticum]|uniref:tripartite tricarboxylate transporter substrate binding protein n=1 Tax=Desulfotignum balticum TaxID=115781 RepID=UPI000400FEE0|nr:tripartite tricarboxylate transporter substrate binding protein [Desulfotignum balticum]